MRETEIFKISTYRNVNITHFIRMFEIGNYLQIFALRVGLFTVVGQVRRFPFQR